MPNMVDGLKSGAVLGGVQQDDVPACLRKFRKLTEIYKIDSSEAIFINTSRSRSIRAMTNSFFNSQYGASKWH